MKKTYLVLLFLAVLGSVFVLQQHTASAATFNSGDVIDNTVFDNNNSMSAAQINNFLNNFPSSCISPNSGFQTIDPNGYSPSAGYSYGNFTTAGQAIYDAAQAYHINPQVLLVTLQKEQGLVSGGSGICNAPNQNQYAAAVGYACPDSGTSHSYSNVNLYERNGVMVTTTSSTCVNSSAAVGFTQQLIRAAWLLKFGEQRSQGNINWAEIHGSWNNSDDPKSCYGGPMTQGTFQICPGGPRTYYDGNDTIDGTSVHIQNGATAALYWYTPHFSGNRSFFNTFTSWFGSTSYPEPLGSLLAVDNQTGQIYFVSLTNNTRYAIQSWSTLVAYNLNGYPIIPMDDSAITGYADGGILRTLVWDSTTQSLFLVDHGQKYSFGQYCTQWGLDCLGSTPGSVSNLNNTYFDQAMVNGGSNQPLMQVNGQFFLMNNGKREPFASIADLQAAGYTTTQDIPILQTDLNATQPLGPLQISVPDFIIFNGNLMLYFDGQSYHQVPNLTTYYAWGSRPVISPPASTTDSSLPSYDTLSTWVKDPGNNSYLVDNGTKMNITADPTNWHSGSFESIATAGLNTLPAIAEQHNIYSQGNVFVLQNNTLRYVSSADDYYGLGINAGNTVNLSANAISAIPWGPVALRNGAPYTVSGQSALFLTNNNSSFYVPSVSMADDFGVNWGSIRSNLGSNVLSSAYPYAGTLSRWITPSGNGLYYISNRTFTTVGSAAASQWGINTSTQPATNLDPGIFYNMTGGIQSLGRFVRNVDNGGIYYGTGGASHYVAAYSAFVNLGGTTANITNVHSDFLAAMPAGFTYGN